MKPNRFPFHTILIAVAFMAAGLIMGRKLGLKHEEAPDPEYNTPVLESVRGATSAKQDRGEALTGNPASEADDTAVQSVSLFQNFKQLCDGYSKYKYCGLRSIVMFASAEEMPVFLEYIMRNHPRDSAMGGIRDLILSRWTKLDVAAAMRHAQNSDPAVRDALTAAVLGAWAKTDMASTLAWLQQLHDGPLKVKALSQIIDSLADIAKTQPRQALDFALSLESRARQREAISNVAFGLAAIDLNYALEVLNSLEGSRLQSQFFHGMCEKWARHDPVATAQFMTRIDAADIDENSFLEVFKYIVGAWDKQDMKSAFACAESFKEKDFRYCASRMVVEEWSRTNPNEAMQYALSIYDIYDNEEVVPDVFMKVLDRDEQSAFDLLDHMPEWLQVRVVANSLPSMIKKDPKMAAVAVEVMPAGWDRDNALNAVTKEWMKKDKAAALEWMSSFTSPREREWIFIGPDYSTGGWKNNVFPSSSDRAARKKMQADSAGNRFGIIPVGELIDPLDAANYVLATQEGPCRDRMTDALMRSWAAHDPQAAVNWASANINNSRRDKAYANIAAVMSYMDPAGALKVLSKVDDVNGQADAVREVAGAWVTQEPDEAITWANSLENDNLRAHVISGMESALKNDPEIMEELHRVMKNF